MTESVLNDPRQVAWGNLYLFGLLADSFEDLVSDLRAAIVTDRAEESLRHRANVTAKDMRLIGLINVFELRKKRILLQLLAQHRRDQRFVETFLHGNHLVRNH